MDSTDESVNAPVAHLQSNRKASWRTSVYRQFVFVIVLAVVSAWMNRQWIFVTTTVAPPPVQTSLPHSMSLDHDLLNTSSTSLTNSSTMMWSYHTAQEPLMTSTRVIALICMGPSTAKSTIFERILISIRRRGKYTGLVWLLTDAPSTRYQGLADRDSNLIVMNPPPSDYHLELRQDMPYKRFKTFLLDYLSLHPQLLSVQYVYYLDMDIVVGAELQPWFDVMEEEEDHSLTPTSSKGPKLLNIFQERNSLSQMALFQGNYNFFPVQGGQIFLQRNYSEGCLYHWRKLIDGNPSEPKDQKALTKLYRQDRPTECRISRMKQSPWLMFLDEKTMVSIHSHKNYSTMMHIKNTQHAKEIPIQTQREFFRDLLYLTPDETKAIRSKGQLRPNRTWTKEQSLSVSASDQTVDILSTSETDAMKLSSSHTDELWQYQLLNATSLPTSRVIALLSMGPNAADSTLVERFLVSLRRRGEYYGLVWLITDAPTKRYSNIESKDPYFVVTRPLREDWNWELHRDMPYKRFKTYLLDYLPLDDRLSEVEFVYYLDVDVVAGKPLEPWFNNVETNYVNMSAPSQMIMFEGNAQKTSNLNLDPFPLQGGQFILKRNHSKACLLRWRQYIDADPDEHKDQKALIRMWKEQWSGCCLTAMPQKPYLYFLSKNAMARFHKGGNYTTLMHIKNSDDARLIPDVLQKKFFKKLLYLSEEETVAVTGKRRIRPNRTWSVIQQEELDAERQF